MISVTESRKAFFCRLHPSLCSTKMCIRDRSVPYRTAPPPSQRRWAVHTPMPAGRWSLPLPQMCIRDRQAVCGSFSPAAPHSHERFADLSFTEEAFENCDVTDCVFVDCSFTKCELDHTTLNECQFVRCEITGLRSTCLLYTSIG